MGIREDQHMERKEQLLQIALDEFITKGYYGTSTREISKIANISSGLMFHYFPSKQALYEALVEIGCSEMTLEYAETDSPAKILKAHAETILNMVSTIPYVAKLFVFMGDASYNAMHISPKSGELLAQHDIISESIPLIQKGQKLGEFREGDARVLSIAFWCSIQGIAESIAFQSEPWVPKAEWIMSILYNSCYEP